MSKPVAIQHLPSRIEPLWDLDHDLSLESPWQVWLGIFLMAFLAALPLIAAILQPEPQAARASSQKLYRSQQELEQAYRDLADAQAKAQAAHHRRSIIPTREAEARHGNQHPR